MTAHRWGRIRRSIARPIFGAEEFTELRYLTAEASSTFSRLFRSGAITSTVPFNSSNRRIIQHLTAAAYLNVCRHCYVGAFDSDSTANPAQLYRSFADERHGGLLSLPQSDAAAFDDWFSGCASAGAHPFEIVRNEVLLSVHSAPTGPGYWLRLASRPADSISPHLILIALTLVRNQVPFVMSHAAEHACFARGDDWIGVADDRLWERGAPIWPRGSGILNAMQNSLLLSQFDPFPEVKRQIRWFPQPARTRPL